jgi:hypothetical protein
MLSAHTLVKAVPAAAPAAAVIAKRRRLRTKDLTDIALEKAQTSVLSRLRRWYAWNTKFHLLAKYMKTHPNTTVPVTLDSVSFPKLGPWVIEQRNALRADKIRIDREREVASAVVENPNADPAAVAAAKVTLASLAAAAATNYDYAAAARKDGGSDHHQPGIPHIEKQNGPGTAVRRVARLDSIGFDWGETRLSRWNTKFDLLCKCVRRRRHRVQSCRSSYRRRRDRRRCRRRHRRRRRSSRSRSRCYCGSVVWS